MQLYFNEDGSVTPLPDEVTKKPRITETDINIIEEWLTEMATDPIKAISSHTGDETRIIAKMTKNLLRDALELLKEQEAEIRQLRLALDIAKGTCKGIKMEGR